MSFYAIMEAVIVQRHTHDICMALAWISLHTHGACKDRMHAHASRTHMHMHMHASCNKSHMQHVHMQASMCFVIECRIDILCNPVFDDEDFCDVQKIMLCRPGKRQYAERGTDFVDLPPRRIVIQGTFIRLLHQEMKAAKVGHTNIKIVVAGLIHFPGGEVTEICKTSDDEAVMDDVIVGAAISEQARFLMT